MSNLWIWIAIVSAVLGAYFSALQRSLDEFSRSELESLLDRKNRSRAPVEWLARRLDPLAMATAVWRHLATVLFLFSMLLTFGVSREGDTHLPTIWGAVVGGLIAFCWLWLVQLGLAAAVSEHLATRVVSDSLPLFKPLVFVSQVFTIPLDWLNEVVRRLVGAERRDDLEDELMHVVEESEREGHLGETVRGMIQAIADFRTATVDEIMTPRIDVKGIELTDNLAAVMEFIIEAGHSRFPVFIDDLDHIEGILYVKDLLPFVAHDATEIDLRKYVREAMVVPESRRISDLLVDFQQRQVHMAIVLDEYGGTAGLVTIEDIVEEVVGEIRDEHDREDEEEPSFQRNEDGTIDVDARYHIDDLNDELGLKLPEDEDYDTVGGWVFASLGRIPTQGEQFRVNGIEVTVLEAEKTHINRMRLRILADYESHGEPEIEAS